MPHVSNGTERCVVAVISSIILARWWQFLYPHTHAQVTNQNAHTQTLTHIEARFVLGIIWRPLVPNKKPFQMDYYVCFARCLRRPGGSRWVIRVIQLPGYRDEDDFKHWANERIRINSNISIAIWQKMLGVQVVSDDNGFVLYWFFWGTAEKQQNCGGCRCRVGFVCAWIGVLLINAFLVIWF